MGFSVALQQTSSCSELMKSSSLSSTKSAKRKLYISPTARLFGPAVFEASKVKVLFLKGKEEEHSLPRAYTLTHSDITSNITLAISHTVNKAQIEGWYSRLQRDEVVAEWKKVKGETSLHVHCHISGGHFLLDFIAGLRYYIFAKELPVVLKAFVHGDTQLFTKYPELLEAPVWIYFHSNLKEFNRVEYWGPLCEAATSGGQRGDEVRPELCGGGCDCCFPTRSLMPWRKEEEVQIDQAGQLQE